MNKIEKPFKRGPFVIDFSILRTGTFAYSVINSPQFIDIKPKKIEIRISFYLTANTTAQNQ